MSKAQPELAIVCYSGGEASARVAVEAVRRFGKNNVILLNHDISSKVEHPDIKRFKREVADFLDLDITYASAPDFENMTPLAVARKYGIFCATHLKTQPFHDWLDKNHPASFAHPNKSVRILYGFGPDEMAHIQHRSSYSPQTCMLLSQTEFGRGAYMDFFLFSPVSAEVAVVVRRLFKLWIYSSKKKSPQYEHPA